MGWPRSPLPARGLHRAITDDSRSELEESDDVEESDRSSWTPSLYHARPPTPEYIPNQKPPFQPSYVYDDREAMRIQQAERRSTRLRNCVCCGLCLFAAIFVIVGISVVLSGSPTPRAQARSVMHRMEQSAMVEFTITPKPYTVLETYGKRYEATTDFYGFTSIRGQLFPYASPYRSSAHRIGFNGWIHVETNTTASYDIVLANRRGFRIMRSVPLAHGRSRCVTFDDVPPLHYLGAASERAFYAQDWASFRMNCSRVEQAPVEIVFAHLPFVFCPDDLVTTSVAPVQRDANDTHSTAQSQTLWVHGERMLIELVVSQSKEEAMQARTERTRLEALELWGNATRTRIDKCPYLEAPLASYTPRSSPLIDDLLGNVSWRRSRVDSD